MSINGMNLMKGATGLSVTGGTAATFEDDGAEVTNGIHVIDTSVASFLERPSVTFTHKAPILQSDGSYSKEKWNVYVKQPKVLADGRTVIRKYTTLIEDTVEATEAERLELRLMGAQCTIDSDLDKYYENGSVK
jgi:hypothetical protein